MKIVLMSMPDIAPMIIHEAAIHMPNLGIASVGGNIDQQHDVYLMDLIRKRGRVRRYLARTLKKLRPDLVGLSAMSWQYDTCRKIIRLIRSLLPGVKIVIGGYHATLMYKEIAASADGELIDFIIRGEGEIPCRRLVNALAGSDRPEVIPSLSFKKDGAFVHNPDGELADPADLRRPVRDHRRLTGGYHILYNRVEVLESSRGCLRSCNFCSIRQMYGRSFRLFPVERVLADLDEIYYVNKTRWAFIADDNMVLDPERVIELCDAVIARKYRGLNLVVQADCITMSRQEEMVKKMAAAGFRSVFLGIENVSEKNLLAAKKGNIVAASKKAVEMCHRYGIMVIGGLVLGFPDDDEDSLIRNYEFFNDMDVDAAYCQLLTPYPKTGIRRELISQGLVTNADDFSKYNGLWANVRTRHLEAEELQYLFWYHRQNILGWWTPSSLAVRDGRLWTGIWRWGIKPVMKYFWDRNLRRHGWRKYFREDMERLKQLNDFKDLESYS